MSTRKIRNWYWVDFRFGPVRYRKRSPENSAAGARAFEQVLRGKVARGESLEPQPNPKSTKTFREFAEEWYATYVTANNKPSERRSKETVLRVHLLPFLGSKKLLDIDVGDIERYKASRIERGLCSKTVNNHLFILSKCLKCAVEWEVLEKIPRIKLLQAISGRIDYLSAAETERLIGDRQEPMANDMALVAVRTGMRLGELLALEWSDFDWEQQHLTVRHSIVRGILTTPKSNRERTIPLHEDVVRHLKPRIGASRLVFHRPDGRAFTENPARAALHRLCARIGLRRAHWHLLRHTFASRLAAAGVPLPIIQQLLGHADINTTMRYAHLAPSLLRSAISVLGRSGDPSNSWATGGQQVAVCFPPQPIIQLPA